MSHEIGDPSMKAIIKYSLHPTVIAIKENCNPGLLFSLSQTERDEITAEISNLETNKATQSTDTKLITEN